MTYLRDLQWGETPWDSLSRDELLHELRRTYAALYATHSVLVLNRHRDSADAPYWQPGGTGARALEMARQVIDDVAPTDQQREALFRSFYRYAHDLLFTDPAGQYQISSVWNVCPICGQMQNGRWTDRVGKACARPLDRDANQRCAGILRRLEWADLQPQNNPQQRDRAVLTREIAQHLAGSCGPWEPGYLEMIVDSLFSHLGSADMLRVSFETSNDVKVRAAALLLSVLGPFTIESAELIVRAIATCQPTADIAKLLGRGEADHADQ